jgi:NAD(P)-dependent dehydrogenase (short-subunit alcohol dehydrogenase family)
MTVKYAVVNGGTRGIGKEIALALQKEGWSVSALGKHQCDARQLLQVQTFARGMKRIDLLVNCAGVFHSGAIIDDTQNNLRGLFETNVLGSWNWIRTVIPIMRNQGKGYIINISSMAGKRARPGTSAYSLTKAAVNSLTESILKEELRNGIRATAICPGDTNTEMGKRIAREWELLPIEDTVNTVLWLLSLSDKAVVQEVCIERKGRLLV